MVRRVAGIQPDQIHVTYWKEDEATVSWVTGEAQMGPQVRARWSEIPRSNNG